VDEKSGFLFVPDESVTVRPDVAEKFLIKNDGQGLLALTAARKVLAEVTEWNAHKLEEAIKSYCESSGLALGKIAQPIRVAVSGSSVSPPIFQTLEFLGRDRSLNRIDRCIASLPAAAHP
jgi:glutamyl-tRNA synthetase